MDEQSTFVLEMVEHIGGLLRAMTTEELERVIRRCDNLTTTNCDWREYRLAPYISDRARAVVRSRQRAYEYKILVDDLRAQLDQARAEWAAAAGQVVQLKAENEELHSDWIEALADYEATKSLIQALLDEMGFPVDGCGFYCPWCGDEGYEGQALIRHADDCPYKLAREALAKMEQLNSTTPEASGEVSQP